VGIVAILFPLSVALLLLGWRTLLWSPRPVPGVDRSRPWLIGHRGAIGPEQENTLAAFRHAFESGLDGIECDIQLSRDRQLVLVHDTEIDGLPVRSLTLTELRGLAPQIATLASLFTLAERYPGTPILLELKSDGRRSRGPAAELASAVRRSGLADRVIVSSFDPFLLLHLRLRAPSLRVALVLRLLTLSYLPRGLRSGSLAAGWLHVDALHPQDEQVTPAMLARARRRGLLVSTWTINDPERVAALVAAGVDGIMADDPAELRRAAGGESA
jgi:glycerophosphoryl diester phosphodiesterase